MPQGTTTLAYLHGSGIAESGQRINSPSVVLRRLLHTLFFNLPAAATPLSPGIAMGQLRAFITSNCLVSNKKSSEAQHIPSCKAESLMNALATHSNNFLEACSLLPKHTARRINFSNGKQMNTYINNYVPIIKAKACYLNNL